MAKAIKLTKVEQESMSAALKMIGGVLDKLMDKGAKTPSFSGKIDLEGEKRVFSFRFTGEKKKSYLRRKK